MKLYLVLGLLVTLVAGDFYLHNPRGSNDRLNEANTNRDNPNRLFDSQNNAKGGYCYGPAMSYYEGSLLTIEWTNQHGCGINPKLECNIVIQYMCSSKTAPDDQRIRDGTTTGTIPANQAGYSAKDANGDYTYGLHEPFSHYQACQTRTRNMGLWIADREEEGGLTPGRRTAIYTRQNNNGNRHGYECPEERDYYPYWHPSPWKDIAILSQSEEYCDFYQSESQNVKGKHYCRDKETGGFARANNENACLIEGDEWVEQPAWDIPAPECIQAPWSRDNHLGNGQDGYANHYNWTLPDADVEPCIAKDDCNCVLRIRYNISTSDMGPNGNRPDAGFIDWTKNAVASPIFDDQILSQDGAPHQLALDTTQFGRTFQDRSHVFHIRPRPDGVPSSARIFNLNVRGKRGNIVQTYPAVEYDFVPEVLYGRVGDYIHFQWTGCDTNPAGNAGEGIAGTDRNNIVQIENLGANTPATDKWIDENTPLFEEPALRLRMAMLDQTDCLSYQDLQTKHGNNENAIETDPKNCMKLNAANQYFDGGLIRMNLTGDFYYMSSRNNNFSNRGQKGAIHIVPLLPVWAIVIVVIGGVLFLASAGLAVAMLYARSNPHSPIAATLSRI